MYDEVIKKFAEEISSVQPMPDDIAKKLMDFGKDEKWLIENGYKPVSNHKFLWIKDEQKDSTID